ncbi:uncharacterized protein MONBRDRAFT_8178 [Monosiga brevicollis MX1]|uniref:N-acetyltransferase domain-containing protein n=1 Tax=Monosiga brevicollis TaxID=81824 RepID=A9UZ99_MONBE|nr:uncharacterized protein MONBRDRAFT_8178 [Monosiga brevicollis MX1]EDQ89195.1 predicted protein [Monosiga brevicollis MX1]|eukprot:XP_001745771.1 hypothetical protein [Monosiga brevicollis MX1]
MEEATTAAEPHPELVGLDTIGLYDQGATVLFQAMRVNPRFRGQGLAKELSEGVRRLALARFPNVRRLRAVIQHHHTSSIRVHVAQGYQCLHREAFGMAAIDGRGMTALARRGQHLFACVRCDGDPMLFARLADAALVLFWHGCAYLCLSYDQALRDKISPAEDRPDARPVPCLTAMATRLPLDFSADYMHGSQAVYELAIEHAST